MADINDYVNGTAYIILYKSQFKNKNSFYCRLKQLKIDNYINKTVCFIKVDRGDCFINCDNKRSKKNLRLTRNLFKCQDYFEDLLKFLRLPQNAEELYIPIDKYYGGYDAR